MRIIGRLEQQAIDRLWQERTGLPLLILMESAAAAVSRVCRQILSTGSQPAGPAGQVLILAGKGQNGGDAFACARLLAADGYTVVCRELFPARELPPEAAANRRAALAMGLELGPPADRDFTGLGSGSLIVDGIFGAGFRSTRPLPDNVLAVSGQVAAARRQGAQVIAIDLPTGLDADNGVAACGTISADLTVTFVRPKIGLCAAPGRFLAGKVLVEPLGIPDSWVDAAINEQTNTGDRPAYYQIDPAAIAARRPERPPDSHKGLFGKVLLLGGSSGMPGAVILAAEAAARSGAGLLTLAVPAAIAPLVLAARPESLLTELPETGDPAAADTMIERLAAGQTAVAAGPGSGKAVWLARTLPLLIRQANTLVLDADALNLIADNREFYEPLLRARTAEIGLKPAILTPHPGEFRRLAPDIGLQNRQLAARQLALRCGCVIVLKGASTVVAGPDGPIWINPTGHDGLARGGSGDVLCGLIAGFLAQGLTAEDASVCGVYLHGLAAELAAGRLSRRAMLPRDVIAGLGDAFRQAGWESNA